MGLRKLNKAIEEAEEACLKVDLNDPTISLMDKLRPFIHFNNLLFMKMQLLKKKK
jgi:hypothetical protein